MAGGDRSSRSDSLPRLSCGPKIFGRRPCSRRPSPRARSVSTEPCLTAACPSLRYRHRLRSVTQVDRAGPEVRPEELEILRRIRPLVAPRHPARLKLPTTPQEDWGETISRRGARSDISQSDESSFFLTCTPIISAQPGQ